MPCGTGNGVGPKLVGCALLVHLLGPTWAALARTRRRACAAGRCCVARVSKEERPLSYE